MTGKTTLIVDKSVAHRLAGVDLEQVLSDLAFKRLGGARCDLAIKGLVYDLRSQGHTWKEIAKLSSRNITTARRHYRGAKAILERKDKPAALIAYELGLRNSPEEISDWVSERQ